MSFGGKCKLIIVQEILCDFIQRAFTTKDTKDTRGAKEEDQKCVATRSIHGRYFLHRKLAFQQKSGRDIANEAEIYLKLSAAAFAHTPSWSLVSPETPIAPTILPSLTSGIPPSTGVAPSSPKTRRPAPPAASAS